MATIVTYVCDVSGVSGARKEDFAEVNISTLHYTTYPNGNCTRSNMAQPVKLIHNDVAKRLGLIPPLKGEDPIPEVTFESKLSALMKEWTEDLVQNHLDNQ